MDKRSEAHQSLPEEKIKIILGTTLHKASGMLLISIEKYKHSLKDQIIKNFIARSAMTLKGIIALYEISDFQGAWILHRCLLDRLFHLHFIGQNDSFEQFDDWSFYQQFNAKNLVKSDSLFKDQAVGWEWEFSIEQKERAKRLSSNKPNWRRPKAEDVAKEMGLYFLYRYGYDLASTHIHPMANDGQEDFFTLTGIPPYIKFPSHITALNNSILVTTLIFQEAINLSSFSWRKIVFRFLEESRLALGAEDISFTKTFKELAELFVAQGLCEPIQSKQ